jgi:solute carrier family 10 (sodium/bile acid cotransporter), member 7
MEPVSPRPRPTMESTLNRLIKRLPLDGYALALGATVVVAAVMPVHGVWASGLSVVTKMAIALLFFLYGVRLARETVLTGVAHWRLHLLVLVCTFVLFPAMTLIMRSLVGGMLSPLLSVGFLFLALLPSTVQSSIAFTSMAGGNVSAALCSAAASNLLGTVLTPSLVGLLIGVQLHDGGTTGVMYAILLQLLAPFLAGQLLRSKLGRFVGRNRKVLALVDRAAILLVVYGAFSDAVLGGLFHQLSVEDLVTIVLLSVALLGGVMAVVLFAAKKLRFSRADQIAILFCGSKKSLATGVPMAGILFPAATVGTIILPLMVFHQIQLLFCAYLASRYARTAGPDFSATAGKSIVRASVTTR